MGISDRSEVKAFLAQVREKINKIRGGFHLIKRKDKKNQKSLDKHGISIDVAKEYVENLRVENYWKGPEPDDKDRNDYNWWFFAKWIDTPLGKTLFYIKIRIEDKGREQIICLSFHEAEYYNIKFIYK
ncbi:MAG: type II toxin-antitoxin system MqsR family toxin [Bacillota bacterium]